MDELFVKSSNSLLPGIKKPYKKVPDHERVSSELLSIHEITLLVGVRAHQIEYGDSKIFTDYEGIEDSYLIALKELFDRKFPLLLIREYADKDFIYQEMWRVEEMVIPPSVVKEWLG